MVAVLTNRGATRIGAIVLAAGASTRLGRPKQLLMLNHETLLERAVRIASEVCDQVVVVLGSQAELIREACNLREATVVLNEEWSQGMGPSISAGIKGMEKADGAIVMTCDMPAVTSGHLRRLIEDGSIAASSYSGKRGVPAFFPSGSFPALLRLQGERGAQSLLKEARTIELESGGIDVDTIEDYERAKALSPARDDE